MNARDAWQATLGQLQVQLNRSTYDTWLRHAELFGVEDGRFVISVPNAFTKDWIERNLLTSMTQTLTRLFRRESEVVVIVWNPVEREEDAGGPLLDFGLVNGTPDAPSTPMFDEAQLTNLNGAYTFDRFVVGDSNRYAALLAQAVIESAVGTYSPVFFHGNMGLGKTHLLQAIARGLIQKGYRAIYLTAEDFTSALVSAIQNKQTSSFRDRFRLADAVLIDDLQFVEGKDNTQAELVAIWDALRNRGKTMVFAADRLPRDMVKLSKDARSRFQAGPIASIDAPDPKLRRAIVDAKCAVRGFDLPIHARDQIAGRITSNIRDLESAIDQLHTFSHLTREVVTAQAMGRLLKAIGASAPREIISADIVIDTTARHFRLTTPDLTSRKRTKLIVYARQLSMYLLRELTESSLPQIGALLGGRDHSTVLHGCAKIAGLLETDHDLAQEIQAIRNKITGATQAQPSHQIQDYEEYAPAVAARY